MGNKDKTYKLCGIICHSGKSTKSGHYVYYKIINENSVILFDDSTVSKDNYNNQKKRIDTECYILMYEEEKK